MLFVAAEFGIREGTYSPLLARYGLGELLRVRACVRRDRLHEVLGDAHALLGDLEVLMCLCLMSLVQQVHNAAVVARSLGCQCDTEIPLATAFGGRTLTET